MRCFLEETAALPAWADGAQIELGQRVFSRFGPQIVLALTCAALPECYAAARGAQILNLSPRLRRYTHRRVLETAQLVLDVMAPGGLGPQGCGIRTVQKVRLLHAVYRPYLACQPEYHPSLGLPINQEDMLGTLMAFSVVVMDSLGRMGVELSRQEEEAYLHTWLVVGYLLGIDERMFPWDPQEARQLADVIRQRHHGPSGAGRALARALVQMLEQAVPGTPLDGFVCVLIRHLAGDRVADLLNLARPDWTRALLWPLRLTNAMVDTVCDTLPPLSWATELFGRKVLEGVYVSEQGSEPVRFHIPPELARQWSVCAPSSTTQAMATESQA
ncbi:MAG: oxygenase MpaB family protein [Myxococcales bacterium]|nr:DUF2236 domain-containing protein [Myxococcota bacterium]MDW8283925.1 oxygenase MpaB family protein [Myxococcales bacterium]